ncbi:pilus assembly FimT family protein [Vibrio panuliri]|uniref:Prepilin-type N-terminal cleavage/methylation domain-containing protein n=1 Tax=Vibrio panuliri TaxID=1381081 RepID=A0ABX3FAV2_9VIBR|nr:prepilin-type N-terminal cleavage/methylation domain-containing protein [Vibrio panuliri]KAB1457747.1 prepilin-type N-terminal cleavage/methylation domain-containing protein [Vibrio panuliri]OLQ85769.1 hypothetical protein BIY20_02970 [Vibrio panuliri]
MKQSQGFTLIELVIVIVILAILAVTAAPRFLNLSSDARISVLKGAQGAVKSADSLVYSKAVRHGIESIPAASFAQGNIVIETEFGHVDNSKENLLKAVDLSGYFLDEYEDKDGKLVTTISTDKQLDTTEPSWQNLFQCRLDVHQASNGELLFNLVHIGC